MIRKAPKLLSKGALAPTVHVGGDCSAGCYGLVAILASFSVGMAVATTIAMYAVM